LPVVSHQHARMRALEAMNRLRERTAREISPE